MLRNTLWKYEATVLSPLHIGSGDSLDRNHCFVDKDRMWVIDPQRLAGHPGVAVDELVRELEHSRRDLGEILRRLDVDPADVSRYAVDCSQRPTSGVSLAVKSAFDQPYLPGSSLKGAIRTVLAAKRSEEPAHWAAAQSALRASLNQAKRTIHRSRDRDAARERAKTEIAEKVEALYFGDEPNVDLLRGLRIGDSSPMGVDLLTVAKVRTLSCTSQGGYNWKPWSTYIESFLPGDTCFEGRVTIDEYLFSEIGVPISPSEELGFQPEDEDLVRGLAKHCQYFAKQHMHGEARFYEYCGFQPVVDWYRWLEKRYQEETTEGERKVVFLLQVGWGTGRTAKTLPQLQGTVLMDDLRQILNLGKVICKQCKGEVKPDRHRPSQWYCWKCRQSKRTNEVRIVTPFPKTRRLATVYGKHLPLGWLLVRLHREVE